MTKFLMAIVLLPFVATAGTVDVWGVNASSWKESVNVVVWIKGSAEDVAAADCSFTAANSTTDATLPIAHIKRIGDDVGSGSLWRREFIWNAYADVGALKVDNVALTVELKSSGGVQPTGVQLWENGPYWAEWNVGAASAEDYGYYFSWGDVVGYMCKEKISTDVFRSYSTVTWVSSQGVCMDVNNSPFTYYNCPIYGKSNSQLRFEGCIDSMGNLTAAYDAATAHWGAPWRMPTRNEFAALYENCRTTWTMRNGVYGRLVTGKGSYSSKSIFFPAAGHGVGSSYYPGQTGSYWSSTSITTADLSFDPRSLFFNSSDFYLSNIPDSYNGLCVRPVREFVAPKSMTTYFTLDCRLPAEGSHVETVDGITWNYMVNNGEAQVGTGLPGDCAVSKGLGGAITIPSALGGFPVTSIGDHAFSDCSGLTSVTIPEGVTSIGIQTFWCCRCLTSVSIPSSVTRIEDSAFWGCGGLIAFVVDSKNTAYASVNGLLCTKDGKMLVKGVNENVMIPEGVTSIGAYAFKYCSGLTSVTIPSSVTRIGSAAFEYCSGLTSVTIPSSVTSIGERTFYDCSGLTSVTIPLSVMSIENDAFHGCSRLTNLTMPGRFRVSDVVERSYITRVTIVDGSVGIVDEAFSGCTGLTSVTIPSSVTSIGDSAFSDCYGLTSVTIPAGVTSIGKRAFRSCSGMKSVAIPSSVTSIGDSAFDNCGRLKTIYVNQGDGERMKRLYSWPSGVTFLEIDLPTVVGDEGATVTGDAETGFVVRPSVGKTAVEVTIPGGIDAGRVTVEVSPKVASVKPNGARVKIVSGANDITEFLNMPAADGSGVIDLTKATVKEEYVKEVLDVEKGAVIDLCGGSQGTASPTITTAPTQVGLFYQLREGETLDGMVGGDSTIGDGNPWTPEIKVKGGNSAFYSIGVGKGE